VLADESWEHRWFLEIDRDTEHRPTILRKAEQYITYWRSGTEQRLTDLFPHVLWIAPTPARAAALAAILADLDRLPGLCSRCAAQTRWTPTSYEPLRRSNHERPSRSAPYPLHLLPRSSSRRELKTNTVLVSDAVAALRALPDDVVDCVVTSPPYLLLRNYDHPDQFGLEQHVDAGSSTSSDCSTRSAEC